MTDLTHLIGRLRELEKKATPGPWKSKGMGGDSYVLSRSHRRNKPCYWDESYFPIALPRVFKDHPDEPAKVDHGSAGFAHDDAALIAETRNALPELLSALQSLVERNEKMEEALRWIDRHYANQDMTHLDFRVEAAHRARSALPPEEQS